MSKQPRVVLRDQASTIFAFPPNRETLGATAYLIVENETNILIDCPAADEDNLTFLKATGSVQWLVFTHRTGIGRAREMQQALNCQILIQEQEAYLLPGLNVTTFQQQYPLTPQFEVIWTPGHSPGSACVYYRGLGGVLFTGRHLLPNSEGALEPIRTAKTFHWTRQLQSVQKLRHYLEAETATHPANSPSLNYICPGANTGFLRGKLAIAQAYAQLIQVAESCQP